MTYENLSVGDWVVRDGFRYQITLDRRYCPGHLEKDPRFMMVDVCGDMYELKKGDSFQHLPTCTGWGDEENWVDASMTNITLGSVVRVKGQIVKWVVEEVRLRVCNPITKVIDYKNILKLEVLK